MKHEIILGQRYIYAPYPYPKSPRFIAEFVDRSYPSFKILQILDGSTNRSHGYIGYISYGCSIHDNPDFWKLLPGQNKSNV